MSKHSWREFASAVAAVLIVIALVTWSALANKIDASKPWVPTMPSAEWFQVVIGIGGLVGLWWTVIFARRAWHESKRSADEAKRSADAAHEGLADARKDAAEQTEHFNAQLIKMEDANRIIRENGWAQTRAYVSVEEFENPLQGQDCFSFGIWNTGATPARGMRWTYALTYTYEKGVANRITGETMLITAQMAGGEKSHRVSVPHAKADWIRGALANISPGRTAVFFIVIHFKDVFGRRFELSELIEFGAGRPTNSDRLSIVRVESSEREITEAEYSKGPYIAPLTAAATKQ